MKRILLIVLLMNIYGLNGMEKESEQNEGVKLKLASYITLANKQCVMPLFIPEAKELAIIFAIDNIRRNYVPFVCIDFPCADYTEIHSTYPSDVIIAGIAAIPDIDNLVMPVFVSTNRYKDTVFLYQFDGARKKYISEWIKLNQSGSGTFTGVDLTFSPSKKMVKASLLVKEEDMYKELYCEQRTDLMEIRTPSITTNLHLGKRYLLSSDADKKHVN